MKRRCHACGSEVEIPREVKNGGTREVICPSCGARAPLKVRRRNGRIRGLKRCFFNPRKTK